MGSWVSLCLQRAGFVGCFFFFPFLVCFVFYLTFIVISMGIWSDIAISSELDLIALSFSLAKIN